MSLRSILPFLTNYHRCDLWKIMSLSHLLSDQFEKEPAMAGYLHGHEISTSLNNKSSQPSSIILRSIFT